MALKSLQFVVSGGVQGVGFRQYVKGVAKADGIVGWVRNDSTGTVSGMAQGDAAALEKFKKHLALGPFYATVSNVEISEEGKVDRAQYQSFDIVR